MKKNKITANDILMYVLIVATGVAVFYGWYIQCSLKNRQKG